MLQNFVREGRGDIADGEGSVEGRNSLLRYQLRHGGLIVVVGVVKLQPAKIVSGGRNVKASLDARAPSF